MRFTVAICTWNRAGLLDQTLSQMHNLTIPSDLEWELLIVNNNSTDNTDDVIARHSQTLPIRRLFESKPGLSNARNTAVSAAKGDLVLWTDDDVLVDQDWLAAYVEAARRWPDAAYFGGMISPWYQVTPPPWIERNLALFQGMLVIRQLGNEERPFTVSGSSDDTPYGANMAFRRHILEQNQFNSKLGSIGNSKIFGEETSLFRHLHSLGLQGVWVPSAKVRHFIPKERASIRYLRYYFYWHGRSSILWSGRPEGRLLLGAPRYLYRLYLSLLKQEYTSRLLGREAWVSYCIKAARVRGIIVEARAQMRAIETGRLSRSGELS